MRSRSSSPKYHKIRINSPHHEYERDAIGRKERMRRNREFLLVVFLVVFFLFYYITSRSPDDDVTTRRRDKFAAAAAAPNSALSIESGYNRTSPFIFIGGVPRSGTTLMRAMLDAHPDVRCGEETRVIPRILGLRSQWRKSEKEWNRLQQAGVTNDVLNSAISSFIINIMAGHGDAAPRICNKDPFTMKSTTYLAEIFPNAKYLMMIRDGRATVNSIISRKVTITGFDLNDFRQCMTKWNQAIQLMIDQCDAVGDACLKVYYEQLVLHPEAQMRRILAHLNLPWNSNVLHHEELIGKAISLSNVERSSDQVVKPVNLDALSKWVGTIPEDVVRDMDEIAPMLKKLGYDPNANPPNYGKPDETVAQNTNNIHKNGAEWYEKAVKVVNDPSRVDKPMVQVVTEIFAEKNR